jgi:hypothetical protein
LFFRTVPPANTLVRWVNENAFAFIVQARPCPTFGRPVHLWGGPHRLRPGTSPHALRIPSRDGHSALRRIASPASEGFSPAFGYDAPHSSARGTSTLPNNALLSAHCEPLRHPSRPGRALASCQLILLQSPLGLPVLLLIPWVCMPSPIPRQVRENGVRSLRFPRHRPSPGYGWVGSCITSFEACSAFTRVTTCRLAESPYATLYTGGSGGFVASAAAPIATGWSDPVPGRVFFFPLWTSAFSRRTITVWL